MNLKQKTNYITLAVVCATLVYLTTGLFGGRSAGITPDGSIRQLVHVTLPAYGVTVAIFILGLMFLALSELVVYPSKGVRDLTYLSLFSICISLWFLTSNELFLTFVGNRYPAECFNHIFLAWAMGFVLMELLPKEDHGKKKWVRLLIPVPFIYGILSVLLDVTGILPFRITGVVTQLIAIAVGISVVVLSVLTIIKNGVHFADGNTVFSITNMMMVYAAFVDVVRVVTFNSTDHARDTRVATLTFMFVIGMNAIMIYSDEQQLISSAGVIKSMAVHDGLTGVFNRMAFNSRMETLPLEENVGFIHFDVNNLKEANDNYGHAEGDQLIKSVAHGVQKAFSGLGECYRYGGDEFTVITDCYDEERIKDALGNLRIYLALMNREDLVHVRMSMACGYDHYRVGDPNLFTAFERADEKMYENKRGMKELEARLGRM